MGTKNVPTLPGWIGPLDAPESESSAGPSGCLLQPVRHTAGRAFDSVANKAGTITQDVRNRTGLMATRPVYTVPRNATLIGSTAMTALVGRVPVQGEVRDPMPFKVITGADNLAANGRDILGEMEIAARIMITGGDEREDARMTRADRLLIRNAIFRAAKTVKAQGREQVITQDVVDALQQIGQDPTLPEHRRNRAIEMGDGMALFCSGLAGHFFNRPGNRWPEADVTILEMGILAREGYEDQLTVAYLSMMSHINDLVERCQHEARPTLVVTDEGHIITTNPLLARYVVKITKMWRKLGAWFWIATQNLEDFPDASRKMLNMMEWWLCLVMPKEEVEQIARFKDLTDVQRSLLLSARKEPGKYVEGVVLSDNLEALFRNVPPPLSLALAMTEKHEKAERAEIMREHNCTELEAVYRVAERIAGARR